METFKFTCKKNIKPGSIYHDQLMLLAELAKINSERVISALDDHLVNGMSRKDACKKNEVSQGYLSLSLRRIFHANELITQIIKYYTKDNME
ncbi:TPA: PapB/FocB family fimbrial expression transcriptional regulator [Escherichia coli]|uniref:PapB/FocB family fimbrial expression transcriptional regulator n=1 Tax=Escherichia coli TaxID=562 RepID=UPI0019B28018|nr:PapB/FocB family fimbrial expression transcriptional regulator [Escherichia coli]EIH9633950.1 transcriptional regulator [Escherichia coli]EKO6979916.1 transcriptional regulator [Escherichia coli]MCY6462481.1 PapB/FocB family fimbrial expression transcriptional regulator [Escherichia coli]MDW9276304.1 PapB/FocB family fimbrial expression transcriptional regulator [Escherichia coli]HAN7668717.1 transcriptional regulator [Escherichia coli]